MISLRRALSEIRENFRSPQWWRDRVFVPFVVGPLTRLHPRYPGYDEAVHVMEEDWDNLFILDACRADVFETVVDTGQFDTYSRAVSLGSHSSEWTQRNFGGRTFPDAVYVSANPHTTLLANDTFHELVEVWKEYDVAPNQIDPDELAEAATAAADRHPDKRIIVHFMQPHGTGGLVPEGASTEKTYRDTVRAATDLVVSLGDSLGGKTVITADHGELFTSGMLSALGIDQHKARLRMPGLVYVPWAVIDGERREITAGAASTTEVDEDAVEQRLEDLGYV